MVARNVDLIIRAKNEASSAFESINKALRDLAQVQQKAAAGARDLGGQLSRNPQIVKQFAQAISKDAAGAATRAQEAFNRINKALVEAQAQFEAQKRTLASTRAEYVALKAQAENAAQAIRKLEQSGGQGDDFKQRLAAAKAAYEKLANEARRLEKSLASGDAALAQNAEKLRRLQNAATAASLALKKVNEAERQTARSVGLVSAAPRGSKLTEGEAAFARLSTRLRRVKADSEALAPAIRRVVSELLRAGPAASQMGAGMNRAAGGALNMRRAFAAFYGDSRRALSLMQRLRGEVLSLTASLVGLYGIFRTGQSFLEAFQTFEAAQNRISAAFGQDAARTASELAFLRGEAERLGFSFGTLSDNYSRFLISSQQAGIEVGKTRTIFRQVSEAARVLKLSNEQVSGVLTALSQIAGKGTLQMEELRQQLGDRLPGAVGLLANALGYGEDRLDEFYKAVEQGQIGAEEALVALGRGLEETYGGQLDKALESVTARFGILQNLLFERSLTAARGGLIDGLNQALDALNAFLKSDRGVQLFQQIGSAMGRVLGLLPSILENFDKLVFLLKTFVAIKVAQFGSDLLTMLRNARTSLAATAPLAASVNRAMFAMSPAFAHAAVGAHRFSRSLNFVRLAAIQAAGAVRTLVASLGGPIGIAVAALTFFATDALFGVDQATAALNKTLETHTEVLDEVRAAYLRAKDSGEDFRDAIKLTEVEVIANINQLRGELQKFREDARNTLNVDNYAAKKAKRNLLSLAQTPEQRESIKQLIAFDKAFSEGAISAKRYIEELDRLSKELEGVVPPGVIARFIESAREAENLETALARAEAVLRLLRGEATEADKALLGLADAAEEISKGVKPAKASVDEFNKALRELAKNVPALKAEMERFDAIAKIEKQFQDALKAARALPEEILRIAAAQKALDTRDRALFGLDQASVQKFSGTNAVEVAAAFLRDAEGFRSEPYYDVNAYRAGFGSDTVTLRNGEVRRVTKDMFVSLEDATRDLYRRITEEFAPKARAQVGPERFDSFNAQQQAALISIAYNYGSLPERIVGALKTGTKEQIAAAIRSLGGDNDGINRSRRNKEAALFLSDAGVEAAALEARRADEERVKLAEDFNKNLRERIEQMEFELSLQDKGLIEQRVAEELRRAELEAQKAGVKLTQEQREELERVTRERYRQEAQDEARKKALEEAKRLEEQVAQLQERRTQLLQEQQRLAEMGDLGGAQALDEEIQQVNAALDDAIAKARAFWESLGGDESVKAIAALDNTKRGLESIAQTTVTTGRDINTMFANSMTSAIDRFSKRVAEGEDAVTAFKEEFLRAAGEILIQIAQMILRQAIFNAISGGGTLGGNAGLGGGIAGLINSVVNHGGGVVGGATTTRTLDPILFRNAIRYHSGGIAGLAPDEVTAVLRKGEEVLTESDPRHRYNGGRVGGGASEGVTIINTFDPEDVMSRALATPAGQRLLVNTIRGNRTEIKTALG